MYNQYTLKRYFTFLAIICFAFTNAQNRVNGVVKSNKTLEPLAYVNIGIVGKGIGTVTNEKGFFKNTKLLKKLSEIGYKKNKPMWIKYSS